MGNMLHGMHSPTGRKVNMKEPTGHDLLATLINLLAEQEGVKITYELEKA